MIPITVHAVRRYIERVLGFPCYEKVDWKAIERFERETGIMATQVEDLIRSDVEPKTPITLLHNRSRREIRGETGRFVVEDGHVITCYEPRSRDAA
jgi:hypothetical protein